MSTINNLKELAEHFGMTPENYAHRGELACRIGRHVYKTTECGCVFRADEAGVYVAGYAEGADAECEERPVLYPFDSQHFWAELSEADAEGCAMWHEWNDLMECNTCKEIELPVDGGECHSCGTPSYF